MKRVMANLVASLVFAATLLAISKPALMLCLQLAVLLAIFKYHRRFSLKSAAVIAGFLAICAVAAPVLTLYSPEVLKDTSGFHPMGLDQLGRDIYALLLYGNRNTFFIAASGSALACLLGFLISALFALGPNRLRGLFNAVIQAILSTPILIYFLVILSLVDRGPLSLILMFGFTLWPEIARIVQARVYQLEHADFVNAARMQGTGEVALFFREILPNLGPILTANFLVTLSSTVTLESILGFLGLGLEPGAPSMGRLIEMGLQHMDNHPHILMASVAVLLLWLGSLRILFRSLHTRDHPLQAP